MARFEPTKAQRRELDKALRSWNADLRARKRAGALEVKDVEPVKFKDVLGSIGTKRAYTSALNKYRKPVGFVPSLKLQQEYKQELKVYQQNVRANVQKFAAAGYQLEPGRQIKSFSSAQEMRRAMADMRRYNKPGGFDMVAVGDRDKFYVPRGEIQNIEAAVKRINKRREVYRDKVYSQIPEEVLDAQFDRVMSILKSDVLFPLYFHKDDMSRATFEKFRQRLRDKEGKDYFKSREQHYKENYFLAVDREIPEPYAARIKEVVSKIPGGVMLVQALTDELFSMEYVYNDDISAAERGKEILARWEHYLPGDEY